MCPTILELASPEAMDDYRTEAVAVSTVSLTPIFQHVFKTKFSRPEGSCFCLCCYCF